MAPRFGRPQSLARTIALASILSAVVAGCDGSQEAKASRQAIAKEHLPRVRQIVQEDRQRIGEGLGVAAERLAPGFVVEPPEARERSLRAAMRQVQDPAAPPSVSIPQLAISPVSFLAAIGPDGRVIARDTPRERDRMRGEDFGERFEVVARALRGEAGEQLGAFEAKDAKGRASTSHSWLFAAPVCREGRVVGALLAGVPLWREAQRLSRQLRLEHAQEISKGLVLWAYLFVGDRLYHFGTPPELDEVVPDAGARAEGLRRSPEGFDGSLRVYHRVYGFGVYPLPQLAEGVGVVLLRAEP